MQVRAERIAEILRKAEHEGVIEDADGYGRAEHPLCGDAVEFYIKVEEGVISRARFRALACAAAIATSELAAQLAEGMEVEQAEKLSVEQIEREAGSLPEINRCCKEVGVRALRSAVADYRGKQNT